MPSNPRVENVAKSVVLAAGVALLLAVSGFVRLTLAETSLSAIGELEDKIAGVGIVTFDEVCISNAHDQARFNSRMDKVAQRKLTLDEYQYFVPGGDKLSELFYDMPILDGNAHIFVGRVSYRNGSHNCLVVMKISERVAMRHWLNLHLTKYSRSPLERDKRAPLYFVNRGPKKDILVQISHEQVGERRDHMSYYSFFK